MTVPKKQKRAAALKKYLLRKCNCCVDVVTLKKCEKVAYPKIKLSWKRRNTCQRGNRYLQKKKKKKIDYWWNYFPERFPHPEKHSYEIPNEYWALQIDGGRNHSVMSVSWYLHKFLKLYVSQTKKMSQLQKQPPEVFYRKSLKISQYSQEKTPALETLFNRIACAGLKTCNCIK